MEFRVHDKRGGKGTGLPVRGDARKSRQDAFWRARLRPSTPPPYLLGTL